jgi:DUF4097 and DUF4098 domain-containing protein YvlB
LMVKMASTSKCLSNNLEKTMSTENFEHTFEVASPARLRVSNVRGHVDICPGDDGVILVTAVKHKDSMNGKTEIIIEQQDDGTVLAEAKYENSITNWFGVNKPCKVDFTIRVPRQCSVKANCVSCDAVIQGLEGDLDVNNVSGDLELTDLSGEFTFSNVSGDITAHNLTGALNLNTVSGDIRIQESQIPIMVGKTVSGDLSVQTPLGEGPYEFKTVSGDLKLLPPKDQGCIVNIKSISGGICSSMPVTARQGHGSHKQITILDGGPEVNVKSVSGGVRVGKKAEVVAEPDTVVQPAEPAQPMKTQMQILEEIDSGDLSVEEALKELNL